MYVAKGARKIPQIKIEGVSINSVDKIKFLGRHIKNSLTIKNHYDEVIKTCNTTLNALKMINSVKGGLHPKISVNLSRSLLFSKFEYSISSMAHMPNYINTKLTTCQNQILRKNLGLTPSTPVHIIYALAVVLPPEQRSHYLAAKELLKFKMFHLNTYEKFTSYPSKKTSLGMVYNKFKHIFDNTKISPSKSPREKKSFVMNIFNAGKKHAINRILVFNSKKLTS